MNEFLDACLAIGPVLALLVGALVVVFLDLALRSEDRPILPLVSIAALVVGIVLLALGAGPTQVLTAGPFAGALIQDPFGSGITLVVLLATLLAILSSTSRLHHSRLGTGEYYGLILIAAAGMGMMAMSYDFLTLVVSLEITSIATYILAGSQREDLRSNESAIKYFVQGAFSTGLLLFGIAFYYGATGTISLNPEQLGTANNLNTGLLLVPALALLLIGFAFKVGAAPFHVWIPDVYEGAPTPVTSLMATAVKAAGFAVFYRVLVAAFGPLMSEPDTKLSFDVLSSLLWAMAALTMIIGNFAAIRQLSIKRMLAYSGIAHTGYLMIAFATWAHTASISGEAFGRPRQEAMIFYLLVYGIMTVGSFGVLTLARDRQGRQLETFQQLAGLARRQPLVALSMTVFMVSLAGLPPLGGFVAKFLIFRDAVQEGLWALAVLGIITSAVSLYYYLRVPVYMYMYEPDSFVRPLFQPQVALEAAGGSQVAQSNPDASNPEGVAQDQSEASATDDSAPSATGTGVELPALFEPDWGARFVIYGGALLTVALGIKPDLVTWLGAGLWSTW